MADQNIGTTLIERRPAPPAAPVHPVVRPSTGGQLAQPFASGPVDRLAVASAVCGLVPVIPVLSQLAGIVLGVMAIRRIRRARKDGYVMGGLGWAVAGIASSTVFLLASVFILIVLGSVLWLFAHTASTIDQIKVP